MVLRVLELPRRRGLHLMLVAGGVMPRVSRRHTIRIIGIRGVIRMLGVGMRVIGVRGVARMLGKGLIMIMGWLGCFIGVGIELLWMWSVSRGGHYRMCRAPLWCTSFPSSCHLHLGRTAILWEQGVILQQSPLFLLLLAHRQLLDLCIVSPGLVEVEVPIDDPPDDERGDGPCSPQYQQE